MRKNSLFIIAPAFLAFTCLLGCDSTNEVTVKFDTDGGTEIADVKVKKGEKVARPTTDPVKDNYIFKNWYTTKDGDDKFDFDKAITANTTIYAQYKNVKELTITTAFTPAEYEVGDEFDDLDLNVVATYSDGSVNTISGEDYTSSPAFPYTFKDEDIGTKTFTITYLNKSKDVSVTVKAAKTEEEKFYEVYGKASKNFQESKLVYEPSDITYKYDDAEKTIKNVAYVTTDTEKVRHANISTSDDSQEIAGGEVLTYFDDNTKGIKLYISSLKEGGATVTFSSDITTGESGFSYENSSYQISGSYKFNKNGYITECKYKQNQQENTLTFVYNGEPHESAEDKFYAVYKKASDAFQKSTLVYDEFDIGYEYGGSPLGITSITYSTEGDERSATLKVVGDITIGGGDLTYYDDEDKGIKAYIKGAITQFGLDKVEYTSDAKTGTCGFTMVMGALSLPIMFNKDGYVTSTEGGTITYTGNPHKTSIAVECPYDTQESKYISKTSTTLGTRETLYATINDETMPAFDTVECPDFTLGYGSDDYDVRVEEIYLDSQGTKATYGDDYTVANNKITFTSDRTEYTIIVLKATNANGVSSLNVNAYKAS